MPANQNRPKTYQKPGSLKQLRGALWRVILALEDLLEADDPNVTIRVAHALATVAGSYLKAVEGHEFEARIAALEAMVKERAATNGRHHEPIVTR